MWIKYVTTALLLAILICCVPISLSDEMEIRDTEGYEYRHPFLVSVQLDNIHRCTGTIVAPTWILTAAFCANHHFQRITIEYGAPVLNKSDDNIVQIKARYFSNKVKGYNESHIALIQLQESLSYNKHVSPVILPEEDVDLAGDFTELVGWMYYMGEYGYRDTPQAVDLLVKSNEECADQLGSFWNSSVNLCTTYEYHIDVKKTYPCMAFGAPLMYDHIQVGIAAQLPGTHICDLPNYFVRIAYYTKWIMSVMEKYSNSKINDRNML